MRANRRRSPERRRRGRRAPDRGRSVSRDEGAAREGGYSRVLAGGGGGGLAPLLCSSFSFHTSPPSKNSFFQMGTVAFSSSIIHLVASSASALCALLAAMTTLLSPTLTVRFDARQRLRQRPAPARHRARSRSFFTAMGRSTRTRAGPRVCRTRPRRPDEPRSRPPRGGDEAREGVQGQGAGVISTWSSGEDAP